MLKLDKQNLNQKTFISCIIGKKTVFTGIIKIYPKNAEQISEELKRIDPKIQCVYHTFSSENSINKNLNKWKELKSLDEIIDFIEKDKKGRLK